MKLTYPAHRTRPVLTLGQHERALWQASTADGREIDRARRNVLARAHDLMDADVRIESVEVYAPARAGGYMVDQIVRR